eukprot:353732-Chlamydomonas_euryale.AAC.4
MRWPSLCQLPMTRKPWSFNLERFGNKVTSRPRHSSLLWAFAPQPSHAQTCLGNTLGAHAHARA